MTSYHKLFHDLLSLQGKEIDVGLLASGEHFQGTLINTMFDSFLVETAGTKKIVHFNNIQFVRQRDRTTNGA